MSKIWLKLLKGEKLAISRIFEFEGAYRPAHFYKYIAEICQTCDLPVPVIIERHQKHFFAFNIVRFKPVDFVETVDFSALVLEAVAEPR